MVCERFHNSDKICWLWGVNSEPNKKQLWLSTREFVFVKACENVCEKKKERTRIVLSVGFGDQVRFLFGQDFDVLNHLTRIVELQKVEND